MAPTRANRSAVVTSLLLFAFWCAGSVGAAATARDAMADETAMIELAHRQPHGPSFDCSSSHLSAVERTICSNAVLSKLDLQLRNSFAADIVISQRALTVADEESAWLGERDRCRTAACIARAYRERIATLDREERHWAHLIDHQALDRGFLHTKTPPAVLATLKRLSGRKCFYGADPIDMGDGRVSYVAYTCDDCKPAGEAIVFHAEGNGYREVLRSPGCYVSLIFEGFQDERRNGLRRIELFSRSSASIHDEDLLDYDGSQYRHVANIEQLGYDGIIITRDWSTVAQWLNER